MAHKIKIGIADDHSIVRRGVVLVLDENETCFNVVFEASDGAEVISKLDAGIIPDVIIMDISMPYLNGIDATKIITEKYPSVGVILFSMHAFDSMANEILCSGALGYISKDKVPEVLIDGIKNVHQKRRYFIDEQCIDFFSDRIDYLPKDPTED